MKKDSFVKGTIIVYLCLILVKILGAIYVIPFYSIIGESGGVLYSYAYNIYNIFLDISTSGIPIAISIIVSEYISLNKINNKISTLKEAKKITWILSIFSFLVMFIFAKPIALFFIKSIDKAIAITDLVLVIRVISLCLLVIPYLSVLKGYYQAHKYATITSYSQVIEQVSRIIIILLGSYIAINVLKYKVSIGVSVALMGGFIGALIALIYLKIKGNKNKEELYSIKKSDDKVKSNKDIFKQIFACAIPLIIVSISIDIYNLTDMKLITEGLINIGYDSNTTGIITSIIATWVPKICVIISAIASGLLATIIPKVMDDYANKNYKGVNKTFIIGLNTVLFVAIPSAVIVFSLATPIYYIFYGNSIYGTEILRLGVLVNTIYSFQLVSNTVLQSMKRYKIVYINTIAGFLINAILDIPLIYLFNRVGLKPYLGAQVATIIGNLVSIIIIVNYFKKEFNFKYQEFFNCLIKMIIPVAIIGIISYIVSLFIPVGEYLKTIIYVSLTGIICIIIYLYLLYKNKALEEIFGENIVQKVKNKFKFKKTTE